MKPMKLPAEVAVCPICKAALFAVEITGCSLGDDGSWFPDAIGLDCETEPDIESQDHEDWYSQHYAMPYVDWIPVHTAVEKWMRANFTVVDDEDGGWDLLARQLTDYPR